MPRYPIPDTGFAQKVAVPQIPLLVRPREEGGSLRHPLSKRILEMELVSDHPVCGASVASRHLIDAAATPPHEEGNVPRICAFLCKAPDTRYPQRYPRIPNADFGYSWV